MVSVYKELCRMMGFVHGLFFMLMFKNRERVKNEITAPNLKLKERL